MSPSPLVLFDGSCGLCSGWVRWVLDRDREARFRFAALESEVGREALAGAFGDGAFEKGEIPDSLVLVDAEGVHLRSEAVLRVCAALGLPWSLSAVARIVPRGLRDRVYDGVAARRHRLSRAATCPVFTSEELERFADRQG